MHVAIDVSPTKNNHKVRGIGVYTRLLIESLQKYEKQHSYSFFTRGQNIPKSADLVHYPYFDPFFLTLPLIHTLPQVVTVHDLIPLEYPDKFAIGPKGWMKWYVQLLALKRTNHIITDSAASRESITRICTTDSENITVIHLAPSETLRSHTEGETFRNPYILYVGNVNWNKNTKGLLKAFTGIKNQFPTLSLVVVGDVFCSRYAPAEAKQFWKEAEILGITNRISCAGHVTESKLSALYSFARACILPSFAEGFGLPVLEAMTCGCPVIASSKTSLAEIIGPSIIVDPENVDSIARGITTVLRLSSPQRKKIIEQGYAWVKQFTWRRVAHETATVYESVAT